MSREVQSRGSLSAPVDHSPKLISVHCPNMSWSFLAVAASEVGAITERRIDRMLDPARSQGLPPFLSPRAGTNSGFMIPHYTAASLAEENRRLATPASVGSLPTSAMQEDHNSLGWSAGRKLRQFLETLRTILAIEPLCPAQPLELRSPPPPRTRHGGRPAPHPRGDTSSGGGSLPRPGPEKGRGTGRRRHAGESGGRDRQPTPLAGGPGRRRRFVS